MNATILHGCPIYPGAGRPQAEGVLIADGRVIAVGALADVRAQAPDAQERHFSSGALLPAFTDPHLHAFLVASDPQVDVLRPCRTIADLLGMVAEHVRHASPGGGWLRLHGYLPLDLAERRSPTAPELDSVCPDRPLHLLARTYHESVVNSAGLAVLGMDRRMRDPQGGEVVRDRRGRATGVLIEAASFLAEAASRPRDTAQWTQRLRAFGSQLLAHGIVRVGDAAVPSDAASALVATLADVGVEAHPMLVGPTITEPSLAEGGTAKVLLDGGEWCDLCLTPRQVGRMILTGLAASVGPDRELARAILGRSRIDRRTAGRWHYGHRLTPRDRLDALLSEAATTGSALAVHAVGNGAVSDLIEALARRPEPEVRIEHALFLDDQLIGALSRTGRTLTTQPGMLRSHSAQLLGLPAPAPLRLFPLRSLTHEGVPIAFGSDYPASELSPWPAVSAAVTRRAGELVNQPGEALTLAQALDAVTVTAARALGVADSGVLAPGMRADLQWVDADPHAVDPRDLASLTTLATWRSGEIVFER